MATKKFKYSSPANVSFRGELDTEIELKDWERMSLGEQGTVLAEIVMDRLVWLEDEQGEAP